MIPLILPYPDFVAKGIPCVMIVLSNATMGAFFAKASATMSAI
jgi:hypothetical protein